MYGSLNRLQNLLSELGAENLIEDMRLSALVTLMVENLFPLMRQDDAIPTQLQYGTRRASCIRELDERMYQSHFHYFTGPKSHSSPPLKPPVTLIEEGIVRMKKQERGGQGRHCPSSLCHIVFLTRTRALFQC